MPRTLGGAEFDPDEGLTAEHLLSQAFGQQENRDKYTTMIRVIEAVPFVGSPLLENYPVDMGPN